MTLDQQSQIANSFVSDYVTFVFAGECLWCHLANVRCLSRLVHQYVASLRRFDRTFAYRSRLRTIS